MCLIAIEFLYSYIIAQPYLFGVLGLNAPLLAYL